MNYFLFVILGLICGILGGMGLGGGTLLIPLVTLFLSVAQKEAQFLNIFSYVFMSCFVIFFHIKNKLIEIFPALVFSFFGSLSATCSAFLIKDMESSVLKILFGLFLIILALIQLFVFIINKKKTKNDE